jgi:geranylgeranyl transferase type-1 subunit beta
LNEGNSGFVGGSFCGNNFYLENSKLNPLIKSHVTMTYTALSILKILGDDYSRVKKKSILVGLSSLQQEDGCFLATRGGGEIDMRFTYWFEKFPFFTLFSACAVSSLLNDFSAIDMNKTTKYILQSQRYGKISLSIELKMDLFHMLKD